MLRAMARTLIKGGTIVTAADTYAADLLIEGEKIAAIFAPGSGPSVAFDATIDAAGKYVMPGGIDAHTHLDMPFGGTFSSDDFETGTLAAAFGGTTSVVDFAIQAKGEPLQKGLDTWHQKAEGKAAIDYAFHMIMTDANDKTIPEMARIVEQGVSSFKLFMAYPGVLYLDDGQIFRTMQRAGEVGALVQMHAENGGPIDVLVQQAIAKGNTAPIHHALTRPQLAEAEATYRAICLAEMAGAPLYIVHLTAERAAKHVIEARDRGLPVWSETCPQYLFLSEDDLARPGFEGAGYVCSPPLRPKHMQEDLWRGIRAGHVQVISTDHCPFNMKGQKDLGLAGFNKIPNGMPGIEERMFLMWDGGVRTGRISMNRFVELTSTAAAKIFGLYPRKGTVAVGADADLLVWDGDKKTTLGAKVQHMRVDYSAYEGRQVTGGPTHVLSRGKVVIENDRYVGKKGDGRFHKRGAFTMK